MKCEILTVCKDAAETNGLLNIEGACNRLNAPFFPGVLKELVIAIRLRSESNEEGSHLFQLSVADPDGKLQAPPCEGKFETKTQNDDQYVWTHAIVRLREVRIAKPNDYLLILQIDGETIADTTLCVSQLN